jgi:hypothetical protein
MKRDTSAAHLRGCNNLLGKWNSAMNGGVYMSQGMVYTGLVCSSYPDTCVRAHGVLMLSFRGSLLLLVHRQNHCRPFIKI